MSDLLSSIFGTYNPVIVDELDASGALIRSYCPSGLAGVDWPYVLGALLFTVVLYCVLRLLGGVLCRK